MEDKITGNFPLLTNEHKQKIEEAVNNSSVFEGRERLASSLGQSFGGDRDIYKALGYPKDSELTYTEYKGRFDRDGIAQRIVCSPVTHSWRLKPVIEEKDKSDLKKETKFEKQWTDLVRDKKIYSYITRVDKVSGIGRYGVLLLGFNDGKEADELGQPVEGENNELMFLSVYSEGNACIAEYETEPKEPRFGLPKIYQLKVEGATDIKAHWSRVLHVAEDRLEDEVFGTPRLKNVFNTLLDLEKVSGGSGEMYWRAAYPGLAFMLEDGTTMNTQAKADMEEQIQNYIHQYQRYLKLKNMKVQQLEPQIADPSKCFKMYVAILAGSKEMPQGLLISSERGELNNMQDDVNWSKKMDERRLNYNEPCILREFISLLGNAGVLDVPKAGYNVIWPDIIIPTDKERAEVAESKTKTIALYTNAIGASELIPPEIFLEIIMGFDKDKIEEMRKLVNDMFKEEDNEQRLEDKIRKEIEAEGNEV